MHPMVFSKVDELIKDGRESVHNIMVKREKQEKNYNRQGRGGRGNRNANINTNTNKGKNNPPTNLDGRANYHRSATNSKPAPNATEPQTKPATNVITHRDLRINLP